MLPPPECVWGMPPEVLQSLPGYDPDVQKNRTEARKIMQKLGHGPASGQTLHARYPSYRDPAVILLSQIKGGLYRYRAPAGRHGAMVPQGHAQGLHRRSQCYRDRRRRPGSAMCGAERNYTGYCSP